MPINNKVTLIGNLGDNPKTHTAKAGHEFVTFSLATNRYKKNADGTKNTQTAWHDCVVYGPRAQVIKNYAKKGSGLVVEGELGYSSYEKNGVHVKKAVIHVYDFQFIGDRRQSHDIGSPVMPTPSANLTPGQQPKDVINSQLPQDTSHSMQNEYHDKAPDHIDHTDDNFGIDTEFANALGDSDFVNEALVDNLNIPF